MNIRIEVISPENILQIIPLLQKINHKTPLDLLKERTLEMAGLPNYECIGLYDSFNLIGITGLWYSTRHYIGRTVEVDHVIIDETYRSQGLGKQFLEWISAYTKSKGCEAVELNTYSENRKSHKFYYNEGFEIYGFHFLKIMREDKEFY